MSGFGKCCDCRESHLLCDLPKVLTDKSQVCAVDLLLLTLGARRFSCALRRSCLRPSADETKLPVAREKKPLVPRVRVTS